MATIARLTDKLASSPATSISLAAAELGLQIEQQSLDKMLGIDHQAALSDMFRIDSRDALASINAALGLSDDSIMRAALAPFDGQMTAYQAALNGIGLHGEQMQAAMRAALTSLTEPMTAFQEAVQASSRAMLDQFNDAFTLGAVWPDTSHIVGFFDQFNGDQVAGILTARQAPAVISRRPEPQPEPQPPQNGNFGIAPAQPGLPVDWQQALADALRAGRAKPEHIVQWLLQQERGSQQPPMWADIELIALDYKRSGHNYESLTAFARKHGRHRTTVDRYLKMYEAATGERVRPGQGRAKRSSRR